MKEIEKQGRGMEGKETHREANWEAVEDFYGGREGVPQSLSIYVHHLDILKARFRLSEFLFSQLFPGSVWEISRG